MIKSKSQVELNILCCQKCGAEIIHIGKNMQLFILSIHYKCLNCNTIGLFDSIMIDTTDKINSKKKGKGGK